MTQDHSPAFFCRVCWLLLLASVAVGCAVNPATGERDFVLMSEAAEIKLGRQSHQQIIDQFGLYDDSELQSYVQQVGEQLALKSHRADLVYRFTVLDSDQVNAFALPGGYIYITRGIMAYLNSEAELAAVLGHEIGHVTARHGVQQLSQQQATGLGYLIGSIFVPALRSAGAQNLFNLLGSAWVRGYGREHELEADSLGAEYIARSGYQPKAMIEVIGVLKDQEIFDKELAKKEGREPRAYHGVFATHPKNDTRLQQVVGRANALATADANQINRDEYLSKIEGMVFGDSEAQGIRRGSSFYHAELGFALAFPEGWRIDNRPSAIVAQAPQGAAVIQISAEDINKRIAADEFIKTRLKVNSLKQGRALSSHGLAGYTGLTRGNTPFGQRDIRISVMYLGTKAYTFFATTKDAGALKSFDGAFLDTVTSFHPLSDEEQPLAKALLIQLVTARDGDTYAALAKQTRISNDAESQLRLMNDQYPQGEPTPGQRIKIVK